MIMSHLYTKTRSCFFRHLSLSAQPTFYFSRKEKMKFHTLISSVFVVLFLSILAGCISFHPLGMTDSEWNDLTPQQKMEAREKQAQLNKQKKQAKIDKETAAQAASAKRYETARYGDIITVVIKGGTMDINGKRREYEPIIFDIVRGESKPIDIIRKGKKHYKDTAVMRLSEDGRTFYFDDKQRDNLTLIDEGWEHGKTYKIKELKNRNTNPRDIEINIRYRPVEGRRNQVIIIRE